MENSPYHAQIEAYLCGELSPNEHAAFEAELARNPALQAAVTQRQADLDAYDDEEDPISETLKAQAMAEAVRQAWRDLQTTEAEPPEAKTIIARWGWKEVTILAAAACALLILAYQIMVPRWNPDHQLAGKHNGIQSQSDLPTASRDSLFAVAIGLDLPLPDSAYRLAPGDSSLRGLRTREPAVWVPGLSSSAELSPVARLYLAWGYLQLDQPQAAQETLDGLEDWPATVAWLRGLAAFRTGADQEARTHFDQIFYQSTEFPYEKTVIDILDVLQEASL